jgi:hypothetical protein
MDMAKESMKIIKAIGIMITIVIPIMIGMGLCNNNYPGYYSDANLYFYGGPSVEYKFSAVPSESSINFRNPGDRFWSDSED